MITKKDLLVLLPLLLLVQSLFAQKGSVSGKITDDSLQALELVTVKLIGTSYITSTDSKGYFKIANVKPGTYHLFCTSFQIDTISTDVIVVADQQTHLSLRAKYTTYSMPDVVVTATRTEKDANAIPIPVKVISSEQIRQMGSARLNEVLSEQTGLAIINDHGTGIQMQGLNSEYTLILLNGEPLVGRTAGTLDLTRIAVGNIKQIEIVKGPSSSLYGSEALAGVINIITDKPKDRVVGSFKTRYASNNTLGLTGDVNFNLGKSKINLFADRYSSSGYYLTSSEDKTVPPYQNYTLQCTYAYKFNPRTELSITARLFTQNSQGTFSIEEGEQTYKVGDKGGQYDWNFNPVLTFYATEKDKISLRSYTTSYHTQSLMTKVLDGSVYDDSYFNQLFNREELQYDRIWNSKQRTTIGAGCLLESVNSTRYTAVQNFSNIYFLAQHDFTPIKKVDLIIGARMDNHSVYGSQVSPKISASYKILKNFAMRGSVGRGFKAPDFRQLYLNFTNPVEGYSVLGTEEIAVQLSRMQQQGQISQLLIDPNSLQKLKAEQSIAYNIGWMFKPFSKWIWQVNLFRNDITNMIATTGIAIKTNKQTVFSYSNLYSVYTQGIETDLEYKLHKNVTITAGYQYLVAKDKQVIKDIEEGLYFSKDLETWTTTRLTKSDYGGLFNRSKHMANLRIFYNHQKSGWMANVRGIYRGRYGFNDINGNLILDADNEYVPGYILWNIAAGKRIIRNMIFQVGIDNISGYTNPLYISSLPGRIYYGSLTIPLSKETFKLKQI